MNVFKHGICSTQSQLDLRWNQTCDGYFSLPFGWLDDWLPEPLMVLHLRGFIMIKLKCHHFISTVLIYTPHAGIWLIQWVNLIVMKGSPEAASKWFWKTQPLLRIQMWEVRWLIRYFHFECCLHRSQYFVRKQIFAGLIILVRHVGNCVLLLFVTVGGHDLYWQQFKNKVLCSTKWHVYTGRYLHVCSSTDWL